jgi:pSer/pThr/pTyr-binding forkhead associated (FHA) protein
MSGGLPGLLIRNAKAVIERAGPGPVREEDVRRHQVESQNRPAMPRLIVTTNGKTIEEFEFKERKVTLGRSNICDVVIYNEFASKFHALLILYADALILVDLNSSNGTFVNSVRVSSTILRSHDIISLADYRIKVLDAPEPGSDQASMAAASDTSKMKTLDEVRREKKEKQRLLVVHQQSGA